MSEREKIIAEVVEVLEKRRAVYLVKMERTNPMARDTLTENEKYSHTVEAHDWAISAVQALAEKEPSA